MSLASAGEQGLLSAGASASLSRLMNKLQKPRKSRVSSDPAPVASPLVDTNGAVSNGAPALNNLFFSPTNLSMLLRMQGGREYQCMIGM